MRLLAGSASAPTSPPADLADAASVEGLVPEAERLMGGLDILVNNAGLTRDGLAVRMKDDGLAGRAARQPGGRLPAVARRAERHDAAAFRAHRRHHLGRRRHRQCRAGELRRLEGRHDRHVEGARAGGREPRHHRELRGARASSRAP